MSTTFILQSTSTTLPSSPNLSLLPFSLGPSQNPYTSTQTPLSSYFNPRPCPASLSSLSGIPEGTPLAAFRGRQLVGQTITVPNGYKGVILSTGKRPDRGGVEVRKSLPESKGREWPLTPASSSVSVMNDYPILEDLDEGLGLRRSPRKSGGRIRGAGQVALAKPKVRQVLGKVDKRQKFALDSDEDDQDEEADTVEEARTPSKRLRRDLGSSTVTPKKGKDDISKPPEIVVVAPTPLKVPLSPPIQSLPKYQDEDLESDSQEETFDVKVESQIIPSPATEDDPPAFEIDKVEEVKKRHKEEIVEEREDEESSSNVRNLKPVARFESFILWTPDVPLPGFKPDELLRKAERIAAERAEPLGGEVKSADQKSLEKTANGYLDDGWWRLGGAGEGGDEIVRGLGEWLGLVEMLNKPVYLEGTEEDLEDEE